MKHPLYLIALLMLLVALVPTPAQAADIFTVSRMKFTSSATSASAAKAEVLKMARRISFNRVMSRIAHVDDLSFAAAVEDREIELAVTSFSISNEKFSNVAYTANITIKFNRERVLEILRSRGINYVLERGRAVLLVPVYQNEDGIRIVPDNPLLAAAREFDLENNLAGIFLPRDGDADNLPLEVINSDQRTAFAPIVNARNLSNIYILWSKSGGREVQTRLRTIGSGELLTFNTPNVESKETGESVPDFPAIIDRAVEEINHFARTEIREQTEEGTQNATLLIPLSSLGSFARIMNKLSALDFIKSTDIVAMRQSVAQVKLTFEVNQKAFRKMMEDAMFFLTPREEGVFLLEVN